MGRNNTCFCGSGMKQKYCHRDIEPNSVFADLIRCHIDLDTALSKSTNPMGCSLGCVECCSHVFSISFVEFAYLAYTYIEKGGDLSRLLLRGEEIYKQICKDHPRLIYLLDKWMHEKTIEGKIDVTPELVEYLLNIRYICPFLDMETKGCSVYESRPFLCRKHGKAYADQIEIPPSFEPCSKDSTHVKKEDLVDLSEFISNPIIASMYEVDKSGKNVLDDLVPIFCYCHFFYGTDRKNEKLKYYLEILKKNSINHYVKHLYEKTTN